MKEVQHKKVIKTGISMRKFEFGEEAYGKREILSLTHYRPLEFQVLSSFTVGSEISRLKTNIVPVNKSNNKERKPKKVISLQVWISFGPVLFT